MDLRGLQESVLRVLFKESQDTSEYLVRTGNLDIIRAQHDAAILRELLRVFPVLLLTLGEEDFFNSILEFGALYRPGSYDSMDVGLEFYKSLERRETPRPPEVALAIARLELDREKSRLAPAKVPLTFECLLEHYNSDTPLTISLQPHVYISMFSVPAFTVWRWAQACESQDDAACARIPIEEYNESTLSYRVMSGIETQKISRARALVLKEFLAGKTLLQIEHQVGHKLDLSLLRELIDLGLLSADL